MRATGGSGGLSAAEARPTDRHPAGWPDDPERTRPGWLTEDLWPYEVRTAAVGDRKVVYSEDGAGPVILFVEEGMWSFIWGPVMARLRDRFRVVAVDLPGTGLSGADGDVPTLAGDSSLLEAFVDRLSLDRITLVLHDLAGPVGIGLAARRPETVRGLVLSQTFVWPPRPRGLRAMLRLMSSAPVRAINETTNVIARLTAGSFGIGKSFGPEGRAAFLEPFRRRGPRRRFHRLMASALRETDYLRDAERALSTVLADHPVLTIFGEKNDPFAYQARYRELFPDATQVVIPNGRHYPMADDPDAFATALAEWHGHAP